MTFKHQRYLNVLTLPYTNAPATATVAVVTAMRQPFSTALISLVPDDSLLPSAAKLVFPTKSKLYSLLITDPFWSFDHRRLVATLIWYNGLNHGYTSTTKAIALVGLIPWFFPYIHINNIYMKYQKSGGFSPHTLFQFHHVDIRYRISKILSDIICK